MSESPADLLYRDSHEWVREEGDETVVHRPQGQGTEPRGRRRGIDVEQGDVGDDPSARTRRDTRVAIRRARRRRFPACLLWR